MVLVVDLDGTYFKNDFFEERFSKKLIDEPWSIIAHFLLKGQGILDLKKKLLNSFNINYPLGQVINQAVENFIKSNRTNYEKVVLVTASPDVFVKKVLNNDNNFDEVYGSTEVNLKGKEKLKFIEKQWGRQFHYIGNSNADIPILKAAQKGFWVKNNNIKEFK